MNVRYQTSTGDELSSDEVKVAAPAYEGTAGSEARQAEARLQIGNGLEVGYGGFYKCTQWTLQNALTLDRQETRDLTSAR